MVQQDLCVTQGKIRGYCIMVTNDIIVLNLNQLLHPVVWSSRKKRHDSGMLVDSGLLDQL